MPRRASGCILWGYLLAMVVPQKGWDHGPDEQVVPERAGGSRLCGACGRCLSPERRGITSPGDKLACSAVVCCLWGAFEQCFSPKRRGITDHGVKVSQRAGARLGGACRGRRCLNRHGIMGRGG